MRPYDTWTDEEAQICAWAMFIWTPRGRNHATMAFESRARDKENWFTLRSPVSRTNVFTADQLARDPG